MTPVLRSVIFDFDYTLADSTTGVVDCVNYALQKMGLPPADVGAIQALIGVSLSETFARLAGDHHRERSEEFKRLFVERGDQVMVRGVRLFDSTKPAVTRLLAAGMTLGIVSTKFRYRINEVLRREGLEEAFAIIVGGEDVSDHKPDPSGLNAAIAGLGRSLSEVLYVGDSTVDAETARRAGVPFVAVLSGVTPRGAFSDYPVRAILEDLGALPDLIGVLRDAGGPES